MANLIVRPSSGTSASGGYGGGTWSNPANAYDTSTTTAATATISMWSQPTLTLNFSAIEIPERTVVSRVTLNIIAASSAANLTAQVTINGGTTNIINQTITTANTNTTLTADITSYLESGISSLTIKGSASGYSNATFSVYDVYIDAEYETYDTKVAEYKFSNINTLEVVPTFNDGFKYITEDVVQGTTVTRTIYGIGLPTMCKFNNSPSELLEVFYLDTSNMTDMSNMFKDCTKLTYVNTKDMITNNATNISHMFFNCNKLTSLDVSNWDTSNVTNIRNIFNYCESLKSIDVSKWNTSKVTDMRYAFSSCINLTTIKGLNNWDTSKVVYNGLMFGYSESLKEINMHGINTSKTTYMDQMFRDCYALEKIDISGFSTEVMEDMSDLFKEDSALTEVIVQNSDYNSINQLINELPIRTAGSYGLLDVAGVNDFSQVNVTAAEAKFWNVEDRYKVAEYKFDNSLYDLIPEFNEGYQYTYEDAVEGNVTARTIYSSELPTLMRFGVGSDTPTQQSLSLLSVESLNMSEVTTCLNMFRRCENLIIVNSTDFDMEKVTSISSMFNGCINLTTLDVSNWNTGNVTTINNAFNACYMLNKLDVNNWNTGKVSNMYAAFRNCNSLKELNMGNWDITKVTTFDYFLYNCNSMVTIDISNWNFSSVTSATDILTGCTVRKIICDNMTDGNLYTLYNVIPTADLNEFHTIHANNMSTTREQQFDSKYWYRYTDKTLVYYAYDNTIAGTYYPGATNITESEYTVTPVTSGNLTRVRIDSDTGRPTAIKFGVDCNPYLNTSSNAHKALLAVAHVKTDYITDMYCMFDGCTNLAQLDTYGWNTSNVTNMCAMFWECSSLTSLDVAHFDVSNVEDISWIFGYCSGLTELDLSNWNTNSATTMAGMFSACTNLVTVDTTNWNTSSVTNMAHMFGKEGTGSTYPGCENLKKVIGIEDWNVNNVKDMSYMFYGAWMLETLDLSKWDTSNVENMSIMFCAAGADNPNFSLNIKDWDVSKVLYMNYMFDCCYSLKELDLSGWDVSNVENMNWMFGNDDANDSMMLTKLNLSGWKFNSEVDMSNFFAYTNKVNEVIMNDSNYTSINRVIEHLPQRSADGYGLLMVTNVDDRSQVNETVANTKYWLVWENKYKIAEYKFDNTLYNLIPWSYDEDGYEYLYYDTVDGNITTRIYYCNKLFNHISFGWWDDDNKPTDFSLSLLEVNYLNIDALTSASCMFYNCTNLTYVNTSDWDTSKIEDMYCMFYYCPNLISIGDTSNWNTENVIDMYCMFCDCERLTSLDVSNWNTSNVTDMSLMFYNCGSLTSLDLSRWNTSEVLDMNFMFAACYELTTIGDVSNWDTSKVADMCDMFDSCYKLTSLNVSNWDTSNVTDMYGLFYACESLTSLDLSKWNVSKVEDMGWMFGYYDEGHETMALTSIGDLSNWNTESLTSMAGMFCHCRHLTNLNVSNFDTSNVEYMSYVFRGCESLTSLDLSNWNTESATSLYEMFKDCYYLTSIGDVSNWVTDNVTEMRYLFAECQSLTSLDLSNWNIGNVTDLTWLFTRCYYLTSIGDISNWNTSNVTTFDSMFFECDSLTSIDLSGWNTDQVTNMGWMFYGSDDLKELNLSGWNTNSVTYIEGILNDSPKLDTIVMNNSDSNSVNKIIANLPARTATEPGVLDVIGVDNASLVEKATAESKNWSVKLYKEKVAEYKFDNTLYDLFPEFNEGYSYDYEDVVEGNVTTRTIYGEAPTKIKFQNANSLLNVLHLNTSMITDMSWMFYNCTNLVTVDSSNWDTSKAINMDGIFMDCHSLTTVGDVSNWSFDKAISINSIFYGCYELTSLDVSDWDVSNINNFACAFYECYKLKSLDVSNWDVSGAITIAAMFSYCYELESLDVSNWDVSNVINLQSTFEECHSLTSLDLNNWNTGKVKDMSWMFYNCHSLTSLGLNNFDTSSVTNMKSMFQNCSSLTSLDVSNWNLNNLEQSLDMMGLCNNLTEVIMNNSDYNSVNKVIAELPTNTADAKGTLNITNDLSQIDVATAESKYWDIVQSELYKIAEYKFTNSSDVLPVFNKGFGYTIEDVVNGTTTTRTIKSTDFPTEMSFESITQLLEVYYLETSNMTSAYNLFYNCSGLTYVDLSHSDFSNIETIERMFTSCTNLVTIDGLNDLDISKVHNMGGIFSDCRKLKEINVSNWDVSKVTNFGAAFRRCYEITSIDLNSWNTSSAILMSGMFTSCTKLTSIDVSGWNMANVTTVNQMFYGCNKLTSVNLYNHLNEGVDTLYLFGNCSALVDIDIYNANYNTVNMIIDVLPTRTAAKSGMLRAVNVDNFSRLNVTTAKSKYWGVFNKENNIVLQYKFDSSMCDLLPMFNDEFEYIYRDEYLDNEATTVIYTENVATYSVSKPITNFEFTEADFDLMTIADNEIMNIDVNPANICTRTIYSNNLPTGIYFGNESAADNESNSLLEVLFVETKELNQIRFPYCESLKRIHDINGWDTSSITNMNGLFYNCKSLEDDLDLSNWVTDNVTNFGAMFSMCSSITSVGNLSTWNVSNSVSFNGLFTGAGIREFNASGWQFKKSTNTQVNFLGMFTQCSNLKKVDLSGWDFNDMFSPVVIYVFSGVPLFDTLIMNDSNYYSVNMLINDSSNKKKNLPLKTSDNPGIMLIGGVDDYSKVDVASANSQYWNVTGYVTAEYKFTKDVNSATELYKLDKPTVFNGTSFIDTGIQLLKQDTDWTIFADFIPSAYNGRGQCIFHCLDESGSYPGMSFSTEISYVQFWNGTTHNVRLTDDSYAGKKIRVVIVKNGSETTVYHSNNDSMYQTASPTTYAYTFRETNSTLSIGAGHAEDAICYPFTGTINDFVIYNGVLSEEECNSLIANGTVDLIPEFNEGFEYTYEDIVEGNIVTRTIYADSLPTLMKFGESAISNRTNSLLEVLYLNTSELTTMNGMFQKCQSLISLNANGWDISKVTNMGYMFQDCTSLVSLDVSNWDVSKVVNMRNMFYACSSLTTLNANGWDTSKVTNMYAMFFWCNKLSSLNVSNWNIDNVISIDNMFDNCYAITSLDVSNWNTENVTSMAGMFQYCTNLTSLDVSNWNTENVTNMVSMFRDCQKLTSLDVSNWDTSNVTNMSNMFQNCSSLTTLDVSNFDTSNVTNMQNMFNTCRKLKSLDLSKWTTSKINNIQCMFRECIGLEKLNLSNWDTSNVTDMYQIFCMCWEIKELNLTGWNLKKAYTLSMLDATNKLNNIIMNNSDYNSVNKIISVLPTRTIDNKGTLDIRGVDGLDQVDIATAQSKYWIIYNRHNDIISISLGNSRIDNVFAESGKKIKNIYLGDNKII